MTTPHVHVDGQAHVPQALIHVLFHHPAALQLALDEAGLAPYELALWARQTGEAPEIEKLANWLSVTNQPGKYKPLLEAAGSHLRAGELTDALPVFRWAYRAWQSAGVNDAQRRDGVKLLTLWGECLFRIGQHAAALMRWRHALSLISDAEALARMARTIERAGARSEYETLLAEARQQATPGAEALWERWQRLVVQDDHDQGTLDPLPAAETTGVAVLADVANLDQVCGEQFGYGRSMDYGGLLRASSRYGPLAACIAFVPDLPDTLAIRRHLVEAGFALDLKRPKRSHGRISANADTAMAATAVRYAADPAVGRVELWTGDGDFLKVREVIQAAWPEVAVAFRSFPTGTAAEIQQLGAAWTPIGQAYLQP